MEVIKEVHISTINWGDTVKINRINKTVGKNDIKHRTGMGSTLFGNSHKLGRIKVKKVTFVAKP